MKFLGIDPGSTLIGYAFIEDGNELKALNYGLLKIKEKNPTLKLKELGEKLSEIVKKQEIKVAGVEKLFFAKNKKTAIEVAQARGVIIYTLLKAGLEIIEPTPIQVKSCVAGYGGADKEAVSKMASQILGLKTPVKEDNTADALAIAITTAIQHKQNLISA